MSETLFSPDKPEYSPEATDVAIQLVGAAAIEQATERLALSVLERIGGLSCKEQLSLEESLDKFLTGIGLQPDPDAAKADEPKPALADNITDLQKYRKSRPDSLPDEAALDPTELAPHEGREMKDFSRRYLASQVGLSDRQTIDDLLPGTVQEKIIQLGVIAKDLERELRADRGIPQDAQARTMVLLLKGRNAYADLPEEKQLARTRTAINRAHNVFILRSKRFVAYQVKGLQINAESFTIEDLVSEGNYGLMQALQRFDLGRPERVIKSCSKRVKGAARDAMRASDNLITKNRGDKAISKEFHTKMDQAIQEGRTAEDVAKKMELPLKKIEEVIVWLANTSPAHFDTVISDRSTAGRLTIADTIQSPEDDIESTVISNLASREEIEDMMSSLPSRYRSVIEMYYGLPPYRQLTQCEIAAEMGVTDSRISQIVKKGLATMRANAPDYLQEYIK